MAYSNRGMPMPFDFRNGRTDSDWTTGGKRAATTTVYDTVSGCVKNSVYPPRQRGSISASGYHYGGNDRAIKRLTSPTNGRYTDNNGNRSWRSRSGRPPRRDAELLWHLKPPQEGRK
ncbi:hypothetical protein TcBrA4_0007750 [Trypanosoma cruzi]|nr:hypothetical protein TcBrA4_0007750 [Trypanosoma cruzi]